VLILDARIGPPTWRGVSVDLPEASNVGQFLRWTASLAEMRNVFRSAVRSACRCSSAVRSELIYGDLGVRPLTQPREGGNQSDEAVETRTIFPFLVARNGEAMSLFDTRIMHRALNSDISLLVPSSHRSVARTLCHIGQPVGIGAVDGATVGALRISCGARIISESWIEGCERCWRVRFADRCSQTATILKKMRLITTHFDTLAIKIA
jgi:hypothetical protein